MRRSQDSMFGKTPIICVRLFISRFNLSMQLDVLIFDHQNS